MTEEKRSQQRLVMDCPARWALSKSSPDSFPATVLEIAPEGVGFIISEALDVGLHVYLNIDLGGGGQIELAVEIVWVEPGSAGQFRVAGKIVDARKGDMEKLVRFYCERLVPLRRDKKKILIVEDETSMSQLLSIELEASGYDVVCAHDGESGFEKYMAERPDLIILDIMLPKLNGYEVCQKIRREQDDNDTPIIMLTAKKGDADRIVGGVVGAQRYLTKPFDAEFLLGEIKALLGLPPA
jgi:CheY-like chemotaxis protein